MPQRHWSLLNSRPVADHRIFRLRYDRYRVEPGGAEQDFVVLEAPDWVNVIPLTDEGQVVLIRQYRHGVQGNSLEIPGGMVDPGESPEAAALRELEEETGYVARNARLLGRMTANPAIQNNYCYTFLAQGCWRQTEPRPETFERIEVLLRPLTDIPELIRREEIHHSLITNAFGLLTIEHLEGTGPRGASD